MDKADMCVLAQNSLQWRSGSSFDKSYQISGFNCSNLGVPNERYLCLSLCDQLSSFHPLTRFFSHTRQMTTTST